MTALNISTGTWSFASIEEPINVHTPLLNEYTLRFSPGFESSLIPVDQIVKINLGSRGYQLSASLPAGFGPFAAATTVLFMTFLSHLFSAFSTFIRIIWTEETSAACNACFSHTKMGKHPLFIWHFILAFLRRLTYQSCTFLRHHQ